MESTLRDDEKMYLEMEIANIQANITMSTDTFKSCTDNVTMIFNESFQKFQDVINACTAV